MKRPVILIAVLFIFSSLAPALESVGSKGLLYPSHGRTDDIVITSGTYRISWNDLPAFPRILLPEDQTDRTVGLLRDGKTVQREVVFERAGKKSETTLQYPRRRRR